MLTSVLPGYKHSMLQTAHARDITQAGFCILFPLSEPSTRHYTTLASGTAAMAGAEAFNIGCLTFALTWVAA